MPRTHIADPPSGAGDSAGHRLVQLVRSATRPVILIAHGEGVIDCVLNAGALQPEVRGAFLVAPSDPENPAGDRTGKPDGNVPLARLPFPSLLVASRSDPACPFHRAEQFAAAWGSLFVDAGDAGHLDAASGRGPWPEGLLLFSRLLRNLPTVPLAH